MFLFIDKPKGLTSHDVVAQIRRITGEKKVGHAGTLDPNATGLLIVGIGRASTKQLGSLSKESTKEYQAEICLGEERSTDDIEGFITSKTRSFLPPQEDEITRLLQTFKGKSNQIPPEFSAIKLKGKKAYELARQGKTPKLKAREVEIFAISLVSYQFPLLQIEACVSSGTYIRALARDIGRRLGCGAYVKNLRRTAIGSVTVDKAVSLQLLTKENYKKFCTEKII